jgi:hypothetical protein
LQTKDSKELAMPQLSLYLDNKTLELVQKQARNESVSLSKYVSGVLKTHVSGNWPQNYWTLFGSVKDRTFVAAEELDFTGDIKRERL